MERAKTLIRTLLGEHFVRDVKIDADTNFDGERIFRITVVYDEAMGSLRPQDISAVTEKLWELMSSEEDKAFPVTSFVSSADAEEYRAA
ncbi:hypothetical protein SAMN05443999_102276 [Roseovarius azorensis]|uniref:Uncharacterized protein n=1 Tax=Roseovarius azorensis TaxID=1287727 RepID=A0A1H7JXW4_9RHOB|nr:hypothetical protein [Roseovarius azorensis]SEK79389.1 hypothetical protein SAMN05443999_102276 [Roseovarius azorensis]